ncbi:MAG: hypothetical protein WC455_09655 [Dehalococcoidia bacterium]|jgi:hypothetical protein
MPRLSLTDNDYLAHRGTMIDRPHPIWGAISDFYQTISGKELLDVIWASYDVIKRSLLEEADFREYDHTMWSKKYLSVRFSAVPLQLFFGEAAEFEEIPDGAVLCLPTGVADQYYLPSGFRSINRLQDFLRRPVVNLTGNTDTGQFVTDTSVVDNAKGTITFNADVDYYDTMWATGYKMKSITEMVERFGSFVGYDFNPRWEGWYERDIFTDLLLLFYIYYHGPSYANLEMGLTILNHFPYCPFKARVLNVEPTELTVESLRNGEVRVINNATGRDFQTRVAGTWTPVAAGDIIEDFEILTDAIEVLSVVIDASILDRIPYSFDQARNMFFVRLKNDDYELLEPAASAIFIERMRAFGTNHDIVMWMDIIPETEIVTSAFRLPLQPAVRLESSNGRMPSMGEISLETWLSVFPPMPAARIATIFSRVPTIIPSTRIQTSFYRAPMAPAALRIETSHE